MYLNICVCNKFLKSQKWQRMKFWGHCRHNLRELGLFHPYFVCKCSFREISIIKMLILDQGKPISLILKIEKFKIKNQKFVNCLFIIYKNGNKTSIQPILKSNSTSFMFINIFCEMNIKKVIHWGGMGKWGNLPNFLFEVEFQVYTNIQAISTLLCLLFDDNGFVMCKCNYSIFNNSCYINRSREKSCFWSLKAYSSLSFQPTGIGLGSL